MHHTLTPKQHQAILDAQQAWAEGIITIGKAYTAHEDYRALAEAHIKTHYAYHEPDASVLFKPTRASQKPFRPTFEGALSYFIGGNTHFPEDRGFALQPWRSVRFDNHAVVAYGNLIVAMGEYYFEDYHAQTTQAEYTLGCLTDQNHALKIVLHHSSLPFPGNPTT
jgi:hypothetical protein